MRLTREKYEEYLQSNHWKDFSNAPSHAWKAVCGKYAMPGVEKVCTYQPCVNCEKPVYWPCWNFDDLPDPKEVICEECLR